MKILAICIPYLWFGMKFLLSRWGVISSLNMEKHREFKRVFLTQLEAFAADNLRRVAVGETMAKLGGRPNKCCLVWGFDDFVRFTSSQNEKKED